MQTSLSCHSTGSSSYGGAEAYTVQGKRIFIKDITYYLFPPDAKAAEIAPSLFSKKRGVGTANGITNGTSNGVTNGDTNGLATGTTNGASFGHGAKKVNGDVKRLPFPYHTSVEEGNPTVVPRTLLEQFHFTFLIRDPHSSIASFFRCTIPPLDDVTGFYDFFPSEAGYSELRRFFDYCRTTGLVGPSHRSEAKREAVQSNGVNGHSDANGASSESKNVEICVLDADDLLDDPAGIMEGYCQSVGLDYSASMLKWDDEQNQARAEQAFEKWKGWHDDALDSNDLKPRAHVSCPTVMCDFTDLFQKKAAKSEEQWDSEWKEKYGEKAAKVIRKTVDECMDDYLYLRQFTMKA